MPKKYNYRNCPHCHAEVHRSTYFRHKLIYYRDGKWHEGTDTSSDEDKNTKQDTSQKVFKRFCTHCQSNVSLRTFYYHKQHLKKKRCYLLFRQRDTKSILIGGQVCVKQASDKIDPFVYKPSLPRGIQIGPECNSCPRKINQEDIVEAEQYDNMIMNIHEVSVISDSESSEESENASFELTRNSDWITSKTVDGTRKQEMFFECFVGNIQNVAEEDIEDNILSCRLHDLWENVSLDDIKNDICNDPKHITETNIASKKALDILHYIILFISMWAAYFNISGNAIEYLLHFFKALFTVCGQSVPMLSIIAALFPASLYSLYKLQGTQGDDFQKEVVCVQCMSTYTYDECYEVKNGQKESKRCSYVRFPNHPHRTKRKLCGELLLKEVILKNHDHLLYPRKLFCYRSLKKSLLQFIDRPGFENKCEQWKNRISVPGTYRDIYDGRVWKKFQTYKVDNQSRPFLDLPHHFGLLLNVDWFQPFKHTTYSVGVIYLVVANLPREERFKQENVILIGILPGPNEPSSHQMSFFIGSMAQELKELWLEGVEHKGLQYHAALIGCTCDLPAGRKLCGLLSFSAKIGCSKCTKQFDTKNFGEKTDYGGFEQWYPKRDFAEIKIQAIKAKNCKTLTEQQKIEKAAGCRWTELMILPYFDCVEQLIIDPLHNLYLGICRYFCTTILENHCNMTPEKMLEIQNVVDNTKLPCDIGRLPSKITNFSSFTGDQHRNWTLYYSLYALKPHIPKEAFTVWKHLVEACWIFSRPVITVREIGKAHEQLMMFLKGFESWLDSTKSTPNFHMSIHLGEQILDYGSFYGYWCFPFERYNGIQGNYHTNNRSVELQLMRKFLRSCSLNILTPPEEFKELKEFLSFPNKDEGSLSLQVLRSTPVTTLQLLFKFAEGGISPLNVGHELFFDSSLYETIGSGKNSFVESSSHKRFLCSAVEAFLGPEPVESISGGFVKYAAVNYLGEKYGSVEGTLKRNCHIIVNSWLGMCGNININSSEDRPAEVLYYLKMFLTVNSVRKPVLMACVRWFQNHSAKNFYETEIAQVYTKSLYEMDGPACFVPVQKIKCKFVSGFTKIKGESIRVVIPKPPKIYW